MKLKNLILALTATAGIIAGCNTQQNTVPVCKNNPAIEYAKKLGFTDSEAEIFEPLGLDCEIGTEYDDGTPYDKVTIEKFWELYSSEQINLENIKLIVNERMGKEVDRGEWSALNLTIEVYKKQKEKGLIPQNAIITNENFLTHLNFDEYPISIGELDKGKKGALSLTNILYQEEYEDPNIGRTQNFFGLYFSNNTPVITPDSEPGCKYRVENRTQGEDTVYRLNHREGIRVINPFPYEIEVEKTVNENIKYSDGSWSTYFKVIKPFDSKILRNVEYLAIAHAARSRENNKNLEFIIGKKYAPWYYDKEGSFHFPSNEETFLVVTVYPENFDGTSNYDLDVNYANTNPNALGYKQRTGTIGEFTFVETRLPKEINPLTVPPDRRGGINTFDYEVPIYDSTGKKVIGYDMSNTMSEGSNIPERTRFTTTCKYYTNPPNTQNNSTGYDSFNYNYY